MLYKEVSYLSLPFYRFRWFIPILKPKSFKRAHSTSSNARWASAANDALHFRLSAIFFS